MTVLAVARRYGLSWHRVMGLVLAEGRLLARQPPAPALPGAAGGREVHAQGPGPPRGRPHDPTVFRNRFLLMKRLDRLSGEEMATLGSLFDAHPELGVVWGLVQRFHVIFCAETEEAANEAVSELAEAYQPAAINLGSAVTSFCRWGPESLNLHAGGAGDQRRL